jgi:hypothetical protein
MIRFYLNKNLENRRPEIAYLLKVWAKGQQLDISFSETSDGAIPIGDSENDALNISNLNLPGDYARVGNSSFIEMSNGQPDYVATAFYMINSLQEYNDQNPDELKRYQFLNSYQHRFRNSKENIVQKCFDEISKIVGQSSRKEKTHFFLSHDIDSINGAIIEDGFNVLKKGRIDLFLRMLFNIAIAKPDWLNIDKIMRIESEYDLKSLFFWIVNKGKINKREKNSDYVFQSKKIQGIFRTVKQNGFENGIHKSISSESFKEEFMKYGELPYSNRYHYLKFNLPKAYHDVEEAGLKIDASLGFAEEIGFRNSYGLPFNPYNFKSREPFSFVEVPLHIMDRTYFQYKKYSVAEAENDILDFFERNRENCVISILWHNNFFTPYKFKGYLGLYKKILVYIKESNMKTLSQKEIFEKYSIV